MKEFIFENPTKILFGKEKIQELPHEIKRYGNRVLFLYGKGSIKRNGLYHRITKICEQHGFFYTELSGVDPNPRLSTVRKGAALCREHQLDLVLAVGGGSVIDCAKGIAMASYYDGDPWDFYTYKAVPKKALPIGTISTVAATGSEMNAGSVITNEETREKNGFGHGVAMLFPRFSILDPAYTYSVPALQTAAGAADIMAHCCEFYFDSEEDYSLQNTIAEAIMKTVIHFAPLAIQTPNDYTARANLMWASCMALNGVIMHGKTFEGFNHLTEHVINGLYDKTHGIVLSILIPHWLTYILNSSTAHKIAHFSRHVWNISDGNDMAAAEQGIQRTLSFFETLGLPKTLSQLGVQDFRLEEIAQKSLTENGTLGNFAPLTQSDVVKILKAAL